MLQLKNMKTGEMHDVQNEASLGRAGAKADIQVQDPGVSKRHARVFQQNGAWYLEDAGSSNGTFINGERLTDQAVRLTDGVVFAMSRNRFKVVSIGGEAGGADDMLFADNGAPPPDLPPLPPEQALPPLPPEPALPPLAATAPPGPAQSLPPVAAGAPPGQAVGVGAPQAAGGDTKASFGEVMLGVPKGIAFFMARVPMLVLNPPGTIRKSYTEQPMHDMGSMELISYALPGTAAAALIGTIGSVIAGIISAIFASGSFLAPITAAIGGVIAGAIGAVIGAVIMGFAGHPVLKFIVNLLKGESDGRARTNYMLFTLVTGIVVAGCNVVLPILFSFGVRFLPLLAIPFVLIGSLVAAFLHYSWWKYFKVMKWVPIVILVLGILGALGSTASVVTLALAGGGSVDIPDIEMPDGVDIDKDDDKKDDDDDDKKDNDKKDDDKKAGKKADKKDDVVVADKSDEPALSYQDYAKLRAQVESKITNNPSLVADGKARKLYEKYAAVVADAEAKLASEIAKNPKLRKLYERDKDRREWSGAANIIQDLAKTLK